MLLNDFGKIARDEWMKNTSFVINNHTNISKITLSIIQKIGKMINFIPNNKPSQNGIIEIIKKFPKKS